MENIIILIIVLAFIYFMDLKRSKAESERFHEFAKSIKIDKVEEEVYTPEEEVYQEEIMELDEVPPEQLIKELNGDNKN